MFVNSIAVLAYYFKLSNIPDISNHFLTMKLLNETKWHTSFIVVRQLFTIIILDKLLVSLYLYILITKDGLLWLFLFKLKITCIRKEESLNRSHLKEQPCYFWVMVLSRPKLRWVYAYDKDQLLVNSLKEILLQLESKYQYRSYYRCCPVQAMRKILSVRCAEDQPLWGRSL